MIEPATDRARRVAALSQRLRLLHAELAEQPADMRSEQLHDEVQRALSGMSPHEREPFLTELMEAFPAWGGNGPVVAAVRPVSAKATAVPTDPTQLADLLINATINLSDAEKSKIKDRLKVGGLVEEVKPSGISVAIAGAVASGGPGAAVAVSGGVLGELKRAAGITTDSAAIDGTKAAEVAAVLVEFVLKLEPWACQYWQNLSPDAKNGVPQSLNKDIPKFLTGDQTVTKEVLAKNVYKLRSLVSLLMRSVLEAGKQFGRDHVQKFAVPEIEKQAGPGTIMKPAAVKCWEQYVKMMEGVDAAAFEKRLKTLIAKDVDAALSQVIK